MVNKEELCNRIGYIYETQIIATSDNFYIAEQ